MREFVSIKKKRVFVAVIEEKHVIFTTNCRITTNKLYTFTSKNDYLLWGIQFFKYHNPLNPLRTYQLCILSCPSFFIQRESNHHNSLKRSFRPHSNIRNQMDLIIVRARLCRKVTSYQWKKIHLLLVSSIHYPIDCINCTITTTNWKGYFNMVHTRYLSVTKPIHINQNVCH